MQSEPRTIDKIKRTAKVPFPTLRSNTAVLSQKRNRKTKSVEGKRFSFSDLELCPLLSSDFLKGMDEQPKRQLGLLMLQTVAELIGGIEHWKFAEGMYLEDLILKCIYQLKEQEKVDFIEVFADGDKLRLILKKFICSRGSVYCIPLGRIFKLKNKHRALFHILVSFVKSLPYSGLFDTNESRVDWMWDYLYDDYICSTSKNKNLPYNHPVNFFARHEKWYKDYQAQDWEKLLKEYKPRKPLHSELKELLSRASEVDFQAPNRLCIAETEDCCFEHGECYLLVDDEESNFTQNYIQMLNEYGNDNDITSAYQFTIAEQGYIEPLEKDIYQKLNELDGFLCDFNDILRKL